MSEQQTASVRKAVHDCWLFAFGLVVAAAFDAIGSPWWWIAGLGVFILAGGGWLLVHEETSR